MIAQKCWDPLPEERPSAELLMDKLIILCDFKDEINKRNNKKFLMKNKQKLVSNFDLLTNDKDDFLLSSTPYINEFNYLSKQIKIYHSKNYIYLNGGSSSNFFFINLTWKIFNIISFNS